jgi:hypothetical protein
MFVFFHNLFQLSQVAIPKPKHTFVLHPTGDEPAWSLFGTYGLPGVGKRGSEESSAAYSSRVLFVGGRERR